MKPPISPSWIFALIALSTPMVSAQNTQVSLTKQSSNVLSTTNDSATTNEVSDSEAIILSVKSRVEADPSDVLEIVESEVSANPNYACEIVKTAIHSSEADEELVGDIAEVAITAAPESIRLISQCAIAAVPQALAQVQAVLAKLDPNSGDSSYSAKGAKSGKDAVAPATSQPDPAADPLDLPGGVGGFPVVVPNTIIEEPEPVIITDPNP